MHRLEWQVFRDTENTEKSWKFSTKRNKQDQIWIFVTHHIKTGQLLVECISRYYSICMGKNKENKKKFRLIFDHKIAMLHPIYI